MTKSRRQLVWGIWCKSIGTKAYNDNRKADAVAVVRSIWVALHVVTCCAIILGNGRTLGIW